jgi:hypothetical protein
MTAGAAQEITQEINRDKRGRFIGSGNPLGDVRSKQHRAMVEAYAAEFGGLNAMTPAERIDLDEAVRSLLRAKRASHNDAVRLKRDAREWLDGIRTRRRKSEPDERDPILEYLEQHKTAAGA